MLEQYCESYVHEPVGEGQRWDESEYPESHQPERQAPRQPGSLLPTEDRRSDQDGLRIRRNPAGKQGSVGLLSQRGEASRSYCHDQHRQP